MESLTQTKNNMGQKTAVDWLFEQIPIEWSSSKSAFDAYQQAKQIEKERIINAYNSYYDKHSIIEGEYLNGEKYYNEKYGQK